MKKYHLLATVSILGITLLSGSLQAHAVDGGTYKSNADVEYIKNNGGVDPVDPTDPTKPIDPTDPVDPGTAGPLSIDYMSNIHFGQQEISGDDKVYYATLVDFTDDTGATVQRQNFIQVTDNRGSNVGWHLVVKQDQQLSNGSGQELAGAQLTLANGTMVGKTPGVDAPIANQQVTITPDGSASDVIDAQAHQGMGTWVDLFGQDNTAGANSISLSVPGKSEKYEGVYTGQLTWVLTDTPA